MRWHYYHCHQLPPKKQKHYLQHDCCHFHVLLLQTMLYAVAYIDQQPLLGSWVWLVGVGSSAAELYCVYAAYHSPMLLTDKISSLICSHFILPFFNIFLSVCYVRSPLPPPLLLCVQSIQDSVCLYLPQRMLCALSSLLFLFEYSTFVFLFISDFLKCMSYVLSSSSSSS